VNQLLCASGILGAYVVGIAVQTEQGSNVKCNPDASGGGSNTHTQSCSLSLSIICIYIIGFRNTYCIYYLSCVSCCSSSSYLSILLTLDSFANIFCCIYMHIHTSDDMLNVVTLYGSETSDISCSDIVSGWKCAHEGYCEV
jgi:hypothetical protein